MSLRAISHLRRYRVDEKMMVSSRSQRPPKSAGGATMKIFDCAISVQNVKAVGYES